MSSEVIPIEQKTTAREGKNGGMSTGAKAILAILAILIAVVAVAYLTISVTTTTSAGGTVFPYTMMYAVSFPEGEQMAIGTTKIVVLSFENEMVADVDGDREKLVVGEDRVFAPRHARITMLGIPLLDTDFQILMKYKGVTQNRAYFEMAIKTDRQVPEFLLKRLLPAEMDARPMQT